GAETGCYAENLGPGNPSNVLPYAENASFNSCSKQHESACLRDTRVDLLQGIYNWAD
ncbi:hypothetical protein K469DRAFT_482135, partial [Zopfia rhizophila CBS 207.26]